MISSSERCFIVSSETLSYSILLAEPHPIVAGAIAKLFSSIPKLALHAIVENGSQVLSYFRKVRPQIVILDSEISGLDTLELVRQLKKREPTVRVLIYTVNKDPHCVHQFLKYGAQGLVLKTQSPKNLLDAINSLIRQKIYIDPALPPLPLLPRHSRKTIFGMPRLSPRERQILKLIAEGFKNREIADSFSISPKTVDSHRANIMRKLDAHNVIDLLNWARRYDLAESPSSV